MAARDFDYQREPSIGQLVSELVGESRTLLRQELELAKVELAEKAKVVGRDAGKIAAGGIVAYMGMMFLLAALAIGLGHLIGYGWSTLIVGAVLVAAGVGMLIAGKNDLQRTDLAPRETQRTIKETKLWLKQQTH